MTSMTRQFLRFATILSFPVALSAQEFAGTSALSPQARLTFWNDLTGTGGAATNISGITAKQLENLAATLFRDNQIPIVVGAALTVPGTALVSIDLRVTRTKQAPQLNVYSIEVEATQLGTLRTGSPILCAGLTRSGPLLGAASDSTLRTEVLGRARTLLARLIEKYRSDHPR
jgi:hypothetical protein